MFKKGYLEQAAQDRVQTAFRYRSSRTDISTTFLDMLCQCSVTITVKKCLLTFRGSLLSFSVCLLPLFVSLGITGMFLAPFSLCPPFRYLCALMRSALTLLFSGLSSASPLGLCWHRAGAPGSQSLAWPFAGLSPGLPSLCDSWRAQPELQLWPHHCLSRGAGSPPSSCWQCHRSDSSRYYVTQTDDHTDILITMDHTKLSQTSHPVFFFFSFLFFK